MAELATEGAEAPRRNVPRWQKNLSRYDHALFTAKKRGQEVHFTLLVPIEGHDHLHCQILEIDRYDVKVRTEDGELWIRKAVIAATEIRP